MDCGATEIIEDTDSKTSQEELDRHTGKSSTLLTTRLRQRGGARAFLKKRNTDMFDTKLFNVLLANLRQQRLKEASSNDPDEMLLLSQMPFIKTFSPADKMDFQIKYLQLVQSYTNSGSSSSRQQ